MDFKLFFDIDTHSATRLVRSVEPVDIEARNLNFVIEHIFVQPGFGKSENINVFRRNEVLQKEVVFSTFERSNIQV